MRTLEQLSLENLYDLEKQLLSKVNYETELLSERHFDSYDNDVEMLMNVQHRIMQLEVKKMFG